MANGGGKGFSRGAARIARGAALVIGLNAVQAQDQQLERSDESTQLTDESSLEEGRVSPLELPQKSYTQATAPEIEGLPSTVMEMQEQRQREAQMRKTQEQFVGAPAVPSGAEAPPEAGAPARPKRRAPPEAGVTAEERPEEAARAQAADLRAIQQKEGQRLAKRTAGRQALAVEAQQQYIGFQRKQLQNLWRFVNGIDAATSLDVLGFILLVLMMNLQLLNKLTIQYYDLIPELSIPEIGVITCVDFVLCCSLLPTLLPGCIIALVAGAIIASAAA